MNKHESNAATPKLSSDLLDWLHHMVDSGADWIALFDRADTSLVSTWKLPMGDEAALASFAARVLRTAQRDGGCQHGPSVLYELAAYRHGADGPRGRKLLRVDGGPPGVDAEDLAHPSFMLADVCRSVLAQNGQLCDLLVQVHRLLQEEQQQAREELAITRQRDLFIHDRLECLLPVFLNRMLGGGPGKGTPFFGEEMVRQLVGRLSAEEVDSIAQAIRPELQALFVELYLAYWSKDRQQKGVASKPAPESSRAASSAI